MSSGEMRYETLLADLKADYRPQREWSEGRGLFLIVGHFLVGVAGGSWVYGWFLDFTPALVAAFLLAGAGGLAHLANLAHPERFWRMMVRVRTSWVARGYWGLNLFLVGCVLALPPRVLPGLEGWAVSPVAGFGEALAWIGALVMIGYMGFVYSASKAIPFWNSSLHPVLYVAYALRGGAGAVLVLGPWFGGVDPAAGLLQSWLAITALVVGLWAVEIVTVESSGEDAAKRSIHELFRGRYGGILAVGLVVPAFLTSGVALPLTATTLALIGLTSIAGDLYMKLSSVKAGIHMPIRL